MTAIAAAVMLCTGVGPARAQDGTSWREAEAGALRNHVQVTFPRQFVKAGESYFSPDGRWIIFQAVPRPAPGVDPDPFYSMYVMRLRYAGDGRIVGADEPILVSPPGSANTCGFFHPTEPGRIIFGSTITPPADGPTAGYQRDRSDYRWVFPPQTEVVTRVVPEIARLSRPVDAITPLFSEPDALAPVWTRPGYDAECAFSPDGRFIVHTRVDPATDDPDLYIYDTLSGRARPIVRKKGYDGGPFFSADGRRICYRSDRRGDDLLQLYVMDLAPVVGAGGRPATRLIEHQLTDNEHVNWAPFWHPSGRFLVYTTSEVSHRNYEVFSIEAPPFGVDSATRPFTPRTRRLTFADGFDGMPVFSPDGRWMMWTSQRGELSPGEDRPSTQVWIAEVVDASP
ncbi:MAG: hypothetical protein D6693_03640 [Planctomycetota bacterium]|nr:MAG: hypothetical protein D6693_03640 [Planctomycetota bacterium]